MLEAAVNKLSAWRWYLLGATAGVSGVVSCLAWVVIQVQKSYLAAFLAFAHLFF